MNDIYAAPESEVSEALVGSVGGTVEAGIAGEYELSFSDICSEAADKMNGSKLYLHLGGLMVSAVVTGAMMVGGILMAIIMGIAVGVGGADFSSGDFGVGAIVMMAIGYIAFIVVMIAVGMPSWIGWALMGVQQAAGKAKLDPMITLRYFGKAAPLFGMIVLQYLLTLPYNLGGFVPDYGWIITLVFLGPYIYLTVSWLFAGLLIVEKDMSIWEAMETSRKGVSHKWFTVFGLLVFHIFVNLLACIPLGIGLIWSLPFSLIAMGAVYRNIFGVSEEAMAA